MKYPRYLNILLVFFLLLVIFLACWRTYIDYRERVAPPSPVADASPMPPATVSATGASTGGANWSRSSFNSGAPDGLRQTSGHSWSAKGGRAFMQVRRLDDDSLELRFVYPFEDLLPTETNVLLRVRWYLKPTDPLVAELAITSEQIARLKSISSSTDIPVTAAEREEVLTAFENYLQAATDQADEKPVVAAIVALDTKYFAPTMEMVGNIAAQVRQVFTEDQWTQLFHHFAKNQGRPVKKPR